MTKRANDFWSRRKALVAQEAEIADAPDEHEIPLDDLSDAEILSKFDLPDPDTLKLGDDIKGFMSKAVPEHLRRRALRKLWRTNPVLACLDGLNDYDGDFTDRAHVRPAIQTAYQVGRGMLAHLQHTSPEPVQADDEDAAPADTTPDAPSDEIVAAAPSTQDDATIAVTHHAPRHRMRLKFDAEEPAKVKT